MKTKKFPTDNRKAFTLVELLVVIVVIIVLAGMMLPALAASKSRSAAAGCLANLRQLQNAWAIYLDDNNDVMLPNAPLGVSGQGWCPSSTESWASVAVNTNVLLYTSILIAPYISSNITVFKCPADVVPSANGQRLRSYSMNGQMGAASLANEYNPGYLAYTYGSDLTCPSPANAFVFVDEHPGSINDGFFQITSASPVFPDVPASYLEGGCGFSFADGHGEIHQWQTTSLMIPVTYGVTVNEVSVSSMNVDWQWFSARATCHQ